MSMASTVSSTLKTQFELVNDAMSKIGVKLKKSQLQLKDDEIDKAITAAIDSIVLISLIADSIEVSLQNNFRDLSANLVATSKQMKIHTTKLDDFQSSLVKCISLTETIREKILVKANNFMLVKYDSLDDWISKNPNTMRVVRSLMHTKWSVPFARNLSSALSQIVNMWSTLSTILLVNWLNTTPDEVILPEIYMGSIGLFSNLLSKLRKVKELNPMFLDQMMLNTEDATGLNSKEKECWELIKQIVSRSERPSNFGIIRDLSHTIVKGIQMQTVIASSGKGEESAKLNTHHKQNAKTDVKMEASKTASNPTSVPVVDNNHLYSSVLALIKSKELDVAENFVKAMTDVGLKDDALTKLIEASYSNGDYKRAHDLIRYISKEEIQDQLLEKLANLHFQADEASGAQTVPTSNSASAADASGKIPASERDHKSAESAEEMTPLEMYTYLMTIREAIESKNYVVATNTALSMPKGYAKNYLLVEIINALCADKGFSEAHLLCKEISDDGVKEQTIITIETAEVEVKNRKLPLAADQKGMTPQPKLGTSKSRKTRLAEITDAPGTPAAPKNSREKSPERTVLPLSSQAKPLKDAIEHAAVNVISNNSIKNRNRDLIEIKDSVIKILDRCKKFLKVIDGTMPELERVIFINSLSTADPQKEQNELKKLEALADKAMITAMNKSDPEERTKEFLSVMNAMRMGFANVRAKIAACK